MYQKYNFREDIYYKYFNQSQKPIEYRIENDCKNRYFYVYTLLILWIKAKNYLSLL